MNFLNTYPNVCVLAVNLFSFFTVDKVVAWRSKYEFNRKYKLFWILFRKCFAKFL